jgi:single-stranded-DNA-specific exonuclease
VSRFPHQRWQIAAAEPLRSAQLAELTELSPLLAQVLLNRGIETPEAAETYLNPELQRLASPLEEFPDLPIALDLLLRAIGTHQPIAICGDYDADGMTSTALLLRALRFMGAIVDYAIPSRMHDGYGINQRIVDEFYHEGVGLILTVDNGIAAYEPIARARELGLTVIVTDHHDIPERLPPANAILNPKLIEPTSPYYGVAGVGVAYILAICLAQCLQKTQALTTPLIELFTLGTIADLAPLVGVNRRWVRRGLKLLPKSRIPGVQALIQVAGLSQETQLKPEAIGFRLGPRINAIGRIADPQIVIELLTTDDDGRALELAMKCEQVNQLRQRLCELIEQEAIAWCQEAAIDCQQERVLVVVQPGWHHGVIGIVASRLVERYGVPVFIGTYEGDDEQQIRGSARGIPEFNVFEALQFCQSLLEKYGGHRAAGGFSLKAAHLEEFRSQLRLFAHGQLQPQHLKPLVTIDAQANFRDLTLRLYEQLDVLHPCGIENPDPVFWTENVRILEQKTIGRQQAHLKLTLMQNSDDEAPDPPTAIKAIAWRWGECYPLPSPLDVAYKLRLNDWNGIQSVELELVGVRLPTANAQATVADLPLVPNPLPPPTQSASLRMSTAKTTQPVQPKIQSQAKTRRSRSAAPAKDLTTDPATEPILDAMANSAEPLVEPIASITLPSEERAIAAVDHPGEEEPELPAEHPAEHSSVPVSVKPASPSRIEFYYNKRKYTCGILQVGDDRELRIRNLDGQVLTVQPQQRRGLLGKRREDAREIDVSQPHYFNLIRAALNALDLTEKLLLLQAKDQLLATKDQQIDALNQQVQMLNHELSQLSQEQQQHFQTLQSELQQRQMLVQDHETQIAQLQQQLHHHKPLLKPEDFKRQARTQLGDSVWKSLNPHSQKDLASALKHHNLIQSEAFTASIADYSEAGLRLGFAIEREVIQPFFRQLHQFLLNNGGSDEIGGVTLRPRKRYTLGMLPPLLSPQWYSFRESFLSSCSQLPEEDFYCTVKFDSVNQTDRNRVNAFLNQWDHAVARWLLKHKVAAASAIDQVNKLRNIAAHAESSLYQWQYDLLQVLVLGGETQFGIFQDIYAVSVQRDEG